MASIADDLLLHANIALASIDAVQEGDGDPHRDVGPIVVDLRLVASEAAKASKASKAAESLRLRAENIGEVAQNLVDVSAVRLIGGSVLLDAAVAELVIARALLVVLQHLIGLTHLDKLLLGALIALDNHQENEVVPCWYRGGTSWRARNSAS